MRLNIEIYGEIRKSVDVLDFEIVRVSGRDDFPFAGLARKGVDKADGDIASVVDGADFNIAPFFNDKNSSENFSCAFPMRVDGGNETAG